jgi:hypothetical protein
VLAATIETDGKTQTGYSGDCLPPGWFDKSPDRDYAGQIEDMLEAIALAEAAFADALSSPAEFFPAWQSAGHRSYDRAAQLGFTELLAAFGVSMLERAIIDAVCRAADVSFAVAVRDNLLGLKPGQVHRELAGCQVADWLPEYPNTIVYVRHTIGLADPLTTAEIAPEDRLNDGFPQALEEYVERTGVRYFKIKVSNQLDRDVDRLLTIARIVQRHRGRDYRVTLDGNEQYAGGEQFTDLIETLRSRPELATLADNTLVIEQPLERKIALDAAHADSIRELSRFKPVIIDESDGTLDACAQALDVGYRGVSSKNCKGAIKSLLNAGLLWLRNDRGRRDDFVMTGEDLCSVGIVPTQADLCLAATLGLEHVERNGHHYHPGLCYLPQSQRDAALAAHGDFYALQHGIVSPHLVDGRFEISSLQCIGFGFAVLPDFASMQSPAAWEFSSLGLEP